MAEVTGYRVLNLESSDGSSQPQIQLMNGPTALGWIRFHNQGMPLPADTRAEGKITMNLPPAMFDEVLDLLRNEKPVYFYFASGHAILGTSCEPVAEGEECSDVPADIPITRAPIFVEWRSYNYFVKWKNELEFFEQELTAYPPALLYAEGGFGGHVENPFQCGAVKGIVNPAEPNAEVYGNWTTPHLNTIYEAGLADPATLAERFSELPKYLAEYDCITKPAPYVDFATQVYGNRLTRSGFWNFYDRWDDYALPTPDHPSAQGQFDLGPRPPDPTTWLRKWHDPNFSSHCQTPGSCPGLTPEDLENTNGLSFDYPPKQLNDSKYLRFSVCLNTEGWSLWWKQIMRWLARVGFRVAYIDNPSFDNCWNAECQAGYRAWLARNYSQAEIDRLFTVSTSLLWNHSFEAFWHQQFDENGPWVVPYAGASDGGRIFPDIDSYDGLYSLRLEGPGRLRLPYPVFPGDVPLEDKDYRLTIHYKTGGDIGARLIVQHFGADTPVIKDEPLPPSADWATVSISFHIPANAQMEISFKLDATGSLWLDDLWLAHVIVRRGEEVLDHPQFKTELWSMTNNQTAFPEQLRHWAALAYWDSVVDEKLVYLREMAREMAPDFQLLTNSSFQRQAVSYFLAEGQALEFETVRQDAGHPPGVYRPASAGEAPKELMGREVKAEVLNTNIFDYKYNYSRRRTDGFAYFIHQAESTARGSTLQYPHNLDSATLLHAEVAAFGAGAGVDMQLRLHYYAYNDDEKSELHALSREFFHFVREHLDAYECLRSYAEVGLIFHGIRPDTKYLDEIFDLAGGLAGHGVLWDILTEERCTALNFARYKVLIFHAAERLSETVAQALLDFMESGGLVIASGNEPGSVDAQGVFSRFYVGRLDELFRIREANPATVWPPARLDGTNIQVHDIGLGRLMSMPAGAPDIKQLIRRIEHFFLHQGRSRRAGVFANLPSAAMRRLRVAAWAAPDRLALHLLNYNVPLGRENAGQVGAIRNVEVEMALPDNRTPSSVRLLTPEEAAAEDVQFSVTNGVISFVIPSLHIYKIAMIR